MNVRRRNRRSVPYVNQTGYCGAKEPCYDAIQKAISDNIETGAIILIAGGTYEETVTPGDDKALTLQGGWDQSFDS